MFSIAINSRHLLKPPDSHKKLVGKRIFGLEYRRKLPDRQSPFETVPIASASGRHPHFVWFGKLNEVLRWPGTILLQ
jgi:hypothetical protein